MAAGLVHSWNFESPTFTNYFHLTRTLLLIAPLLLVGVPGACAVVVPLRALPALPRPPPESPSARQGAVAPRRPRGPRGARILVAGPVWRKPGAFCGAKSILLFELECRVFFSNFQRRRSDVNVIAKLKKPL